MKITSTQLRRIIAEEVKNISEAKSTIQLMDEFPDIDFDAMDTAQLGRLAALAQRVRKEKLASGRTGRAEASLVSLGADVPEEIEHYMTAADKRRFVEYFTGLGNKTYAKTSRGRLFKWNAIERTWVDAADQRVG